MPSLISPAEVKAIYKTSMSDEDLQVVIDRVEYQINAEIGAPQTDTYDTEIVKTLPGNTKRLFIPTNIYSVTSIVEDTVLLGTEDYQTWDGGMIERLPIGTYWGFRCVVTYKPVDDRLKRAQVIIDLVRLTIERTAMTNENVAGEYSYSAPDWEAEFNKVMRKLKLPRF
jgi:hypothetical protein